MRLRMVGDALLIGVYYDSVGLQYHQETNRNPYFYFIG